MVCERCRGSGFIQGFPCTYCMGGITNCCDGMEICDASEQGDAQMERGRASQRQQEGTDSEGSQTSNSDHA